MKFHLVALHIKCIGIVLLFFPLLFWSIATFIVVSIDLPENYDIDSYYYYSD